jgi:hypothetical protein
MTGNCSAAAKFGVVGMRGDNEDVEFHLVFSLRV